MTNDDTLPVLRKPAPVPEWIPQTSGSLKIDDVIREVAVVGFDRDLPAKDKLKALDMLLKHKGGYIERHESRLIDSTQVEVAKVFFGKMTPEDLHSWLKDHEGKIEAGIIPPPPPELHPDSPPDPLTSTPSTQDKILEGLHGR